LCRADTHRPDDPDFGQIWQNQSWPIALASRRGPYHTCSYSLTLAGTLELLNRSVGTDLKENIDLHNIKTVFHGSLQLKMKMERPSGPTRPSGVVAKWFLPCPHSQYIWAGRGATFRAGVTAPFVASLPDAGSRAPASLC
jgi:hypothetical protein